MYHKLVVLIHHVGFCFSSGVPRGTNKFVFETISYLFQYSLRAGQKLSRAPPDFSRPRDLTTPAPHTSVPAYLGTAVVRTYVQQLLVGVLL